MSSKELFDKPRVEHSHMVEEDGPIRRWSPRRVAVDAENVVDREGGCPAPVHLDTLAEDSGPVALPEPPPPAPGDDLRLPNPERWDIGSGLPVWFWVVAGVMLVLGTLGIVWDPPKTSTPAVPENVGAP